MSKLNRRSVGKCTLSLGTYLLVTGESPAADVVTEFPGGVIQNKISAAKERDRAIQARRDRAARTRARQKKAKLSLYFSDGTRTWKVKNFRAFRGETLQSALGRARRSVMEFDTTYKDFVTGYGAGRWRLVCSKDTSGQRTTGPGSRQLLFYVNGYAFMGDSVATVTIPDSPSVSIVVSLEDYDQKLHELGIRKRTLVLLRVIHGAPEAPQTLFDYAKIYFVY